VTDTGCLPRGMAVEAADGITESRGVLTGSLPSFFTKLFDNLVNNSRERACSRSVSFAPRAGLELVSTLTPKSP
jgi:hypothetical protein